MDVMHLHSTMDSFIDKHVPLAMMPNEYGGTAGDTKTIQDAVYKQLQENAQFFTEEEETKRVNEKMRPGKPKSANDLFGIDGNFKQLDFDWLQFRSVHIAVVMNIVNSMFQWIYFLQFFFVQSKYNNSSHRVLLLVSEICVGVRCRCTLNNNHNKYIISIGWMVPRLLFYSNDTITQT